ncbi:MAG: hypothetical protein RLZZ308_20 [Candidatus Parcubacteria bacterium]|jgi:membrane protein DedA with SNARE-associated domain
MQLDTLISDFSYLGIFLLMIANGAINFPSSQFLYIICGYLVGKGTLSFVPTIIAGALGNTIGNILTFLLVKKYDKPFAQKLLMLDEGTFTKIHSALHETFSRRGMWWIFFGKLIPSVKAFIPIVAGLSDTKTKNTSIIFLVASTIWAIIITSIGYFFGKHISLSSITGVSLIIGVIVISILYKKISQKIAH